MASTQHTPTELEAAGDLVLPAADELAGRFAGPARAAGTTAASFPTARSS